ncbi:MAG: DUF72 domain-containing protein [Desulfotignum sp.]|nr:DUF72 domain-containing protein [Desulfotignum sp.]MCF8126069.1 DUF72 domain-containing protein [Desulfotignum sp.]
MAGCPLFIGTSGYSYAEWIDAGFYPEGIHSANMLDTYTTMFSTTELNYTWYQMPKAPAIERLCNKVPDHFMLFYLVFVLQFESRSDLPYGSPA